MTHFDLNFDLYELILSKQVSKNIYE